MSINPFKSRYALTVVVFLAAALAGPSGMATAGEMKVNLSGNQEDPSGRDFGIGKRHHHGRG